MAIGIGIGIGIPSGALNSNQSDGPVSPFPLSNIISEYKFEDNVLDTVGTSNGTATNVTYADGLVGRTGVFNGSTSKVSMPTNFIPDLPSFSFSCLLKATNTSGEYRIFGLSDNINMPLIILRLNASFSPGRIGFYLHSNNTGVEITTNSYVSTDWIHITGTAVENDTMKLYVNGTLAGTLPITSFTKLADSNYVGTNRNANNNFYNGSLDCLRFWNKELSQSEITAIATAELAGTDINPTTNHIITENEDSIMTESGDHIVT